MMMNWKSEWQRLYVEALVETNTAKLVDWVARAEKALRLRAEELGMSSEEVEESDFRRRTRSLRSQERDRITG
jgi:hypothetical protein